MVLTGGRGARTGGRSLFEAEYTDMRVTATKIAGIRIPDSTLAQQPRLVRQTSERMQHERAPNL
jgi:hypothetical protein